LSYIASVFDPEYMGVWGSVILRTAVVIVGAKFLLQFTMYLIDRIFIPVAENKKIRMEEKKAKTLSALTKSIVRYLIVFILGLIILDIFGIQTAPILASAGILGLAIGFGAQNLVRDVITGFFLILEDQFSIGDYIEAAGVDGTVEEIGFRTTRIRDFGGQLHIIPNGSIDRVTNYVTGNMRVLVEVQVAYKEDIEKVLSVLGEMCAKATEDIEVITDGPRVLGVTDLADSGVKILLWAKTKPMEQWGVTREIRRRAKLALDEANIEIPFPHMVIVGDGKSIPIQIDKDQTE
jgi:moderate conductance mechanosensitive channel